jgi:hypothetical protein
LDAIRSTKRDHFSFCFLLHQPSEFEDEFHCTISRIHRVRRAIRILPTALELYCSEAVTAPYDADCKAALADPNAQCVLNPFGLVAGGGYEKTNVKCGPLNARFCYTKIPTRIDTIQNDTVAGCEGEMIETETGTYCPTIIDGEETLVPVI